MAAGRSNQARRAGKALIPVDTNHPSPFRASAGSTLTNPIVELVSALFSSKGTPGEPSDNADYSHKTDDQARVRRR